jgi:site-specific DNA recombinase
VIINSAEAEQVRELYRMYLKLGCVSKLQEHLEQIGVRSKRRTSRTGRISGGVVYSRGALYDILQSRFYRGEITHKGASYPGQHPAIIDKDLWDKVQTQFQNNLQAPRKRPRAAGKSLLTGLVYDAQGNRFTPSHAAKGAKRYRYYVSQTVINKASGASDGPTRLPADELEELVLSQVQSLLQSPQRMQDVICGPMAGPDEVQRAAERAQKWAAATHNQVRAILPSVLNRVIIGDGSVELQLNTRVMREGITGLRESPSRGDDNGSSEGLTIISVPAAFTKFRGEVRLVLPPDAAQGSHPAIPSLVKAVARAHEWVDRIAKGEVPHPQSPPSTARLCSNDSSVIRRCPTPR